MNFIKFLMQEKAKLPELSDDSWSDDGEVYVAPMMFGGHLVSALVEVFKIKTKTLN